MKAQFIGDGDREGWDLPLKLKRMRWATYEEWEAKFDAAEDALDRRLVSVSARLTRDVTRCGRWWQFAMHLKGQQA